MGERLSPSAKGRKGPSSGGDAPGFGPEIGHATLARALGPWAWVRMSASSSPRIRAWAGTSATTCRWSSRSSLA